jgi:hypothetical protein
MDEIKNDVVQLLSFVERLYQVKQIPGKLNADQAAILLDLFPLADINIQLERMETYNSTKRAASVFFAVKKAFQDDVRYNNYVFQVKPFENKSGWVFNQPKPEFSSPPLSRGRRWCAYTGGRSGNIKSVFDVMQDSGFSLNPVIDKRLEFLKNHPVGTEFTHSTGTVFFVETDSMLRKVSDGSYLPIAMIIK